MKNPLTPELRARAGWLRKLSLSLVFVTAGWLNAQQTLTLNPVADRDTQSDNAAGTNPTVNYSQYNHFYAKFNLASVTGTVTSAKLRVNRPGTSPANTTSVFLGNNDTWTENGTVPGYGGSALGTASIGTAAGYFEVTLSTSAIQTAANGDDLITLAMINNLGTWTGIHSRQGASQPQLVITTSGGGGAGGTVTLTTTADRDTQSDNAAGTNPTVNYSQFNHFYTKFNLASVTGTVTSAKLRISRNAGSAANTTTVYLGNNDTWAENGSTPGYGGAPLGSATLGAGGGYFEVPLSTSALQTAVNGDDLITFATINNLGSWTGISSRQGTAPPQLVITTSGGGSTVPVSSISVTPGSGSISVGGALQLSANVSPSNATNPAVTWQSSNTSVATVNASGLVFGVAAGSANITAHSTDGTNITSNAAAITVTPPTGGVQRPSYNTGTGFFVIGNKLYDANGQEFRIRGVNDIGFWRGGNDRTQLWNSMQNMKVNAVRMVLANWNASGPGGTDTPAYRESIAQELINRQMVPIPAVWFARNGLEVTCNNTPANLSSAVDDWVGVDANWIKAKERYIILNIANEWGPANSTVWRDSYITAVQRIRNAGIRCTLMIDAGGCGQDKQDIINYAQAVLNADPQKNIIFSVHVYGAYWNSGNIPSGFNELQNTGLYITVGEFSSVGLNQSMGWNPITPNEIISNAESRGFGWLAWQWYNDSNENIVNGPNNNPQPYPPASNLSAFGVVVRAALNVAQPATIFP